MLDKLNIKCMTKMATNVMIEDDLPIDSVWSELDGLQFFMIFPQLAGKSLAAATATVWEP